MKRRVQSIYNFWKSMQYWERKLFKFFGLFFIRFVLANPCVIWNKIPWSIQSSKQRRFTVLMSSFSWSHVSYCPFVWMWHDRILYNGIFRLHIKEETFIISMFACWRHLFLLTMAIWKFHLLNNVRTLKASPQKYLLIFASRGPL